METVQWKLPGAGGRGKLGVSVYESRVQLGKRKTFWRWMVMMVAQQCECT